MLKKENEKIIIQLPNSFSFFHQNSVDFDKVLGLFDWSLADRVVEFDFTKCRDFSSKSLALLILYVWHLKKNNCGVEILCDDRQQPNLQKIWQELAAEDYFETLKSVNDHRTFLTVKNTKDDRQALGKAEKYAGLFNVEYEKTIRYIISELLYNTREHGRNLLKIPSLFQITFEENKSELSFLVADLGIGIKKHLSQTYPDLATDVEAIELSLKPQVSGTFGNGGNPYQVKNNAGVGLYFSTNIANRLFADTYIVSGNGQVCISAKETTTRTLKSAWQGTIVFVKVKLGLVENLSLQKMLAEFRQSVGKNGAAEQEKSFYLNIRNYLGRFAEDKTLAIKLRDEKLLPAISEKKTLTLDFEDVVSAPHSLLNALLATPIQRFGMSAYKKIKIINASPEIRETIDFILDENTSPTTD